ncbi:hypothetical protein CV770_21855 [Bradyrhizobium sp. AC87j1]|uniref:DUF3108 domain-containing protein n=1 Tax=Bradyrhizobium sp. AC87j1 TaxID=2055894 RepID=UPI000CEC3A91|nr:DUF3108 domain-containing protein [Bradyrhizobium sp. AC87j1]PPQ17231.1 hypothetical protein CV770_21855 [Bradyrhizobium sp. AC87j1]
MMAKRLALPPKRSAFRALLLASSLIIQIPTSDAATVRAKYSLSYLGVRVGELTTTSNIGPTSYEADLTAHLSGIAAVARPYRLSMKADGILKDGLILPSSFSLSQAGAETRTIRVASAAGNIKAAEIDPPIETDGPRVPLTEEHRRNVVDPLSALIMPVRQNGGDLDPSTCRRTVRLFTGAARSDLEFANAGSEQVKSRAYRGPVTVCSVRYKPLAGHNPEATTTRFMMSNTGIRIRLAALQDTPYALLISATVPLPVGTGSVQLDEYSIDGR